MCIFEFFNHDRKETNDVQRDSKKDSKLNFCADIPITNPWITSASIFSVYFQSVLLV